MTNQKNDFDSLSFSGRLIMWFAKLFGGRREEHEDDDPARFAAPQVARSEISSTGPVPAEDKPRHAAPNPKKGFDPYNSGAFERQNAWERSNLR
jgi:hypothetical protein